MREYFELNKPYHFMVDDLTAGIYLLCAVLGICTTINITPLFLIGSAIGTAFCWKAKRINLVILNGALFVLNMVNFWRMF